LIHALAQITQDHHGEQTSNSIKDGVAKDGRQGGNAGIHFECAAVDAISLPNLEVGSVRRGEFDYIHYFCRTQSEMNDLFPKLKTNLKPSGMLWLSWPKGKKLGTDLTLPVVIKIGYSQGLVESTCLSVDVTWSGLKFTHPKKNKTYHNSYGQLKA
jgi:hypothetical protein